MDKTYTNLGSHVTSLPETVTGRHVLAGAVTNNGRFIVTVEEGVMKLLTLRGAYQGGLTCLEHHESWSSTLKGTVRDLTGISLFLKEGQSRIDVTAVDGRGNLAFAMVSVPAIPISPPLSLAPRFPRTTLELPAEDIVRELAVDVIEEEIRVGLG